MPMPLGKNKRSVSPSQQNNDESLQPQIGHQASQQSSGGSSSSNQGLKSNDFSYKLPQYSEDEEEEKIGFQDFNPKCRQHPNASQVDQKN